MNKSDHHFPSITPRPSGAIEAARVEGCAANRQAANDPYFVAAINAAKTRTYRAAVSAGLTSADREDLYQSILLDIVERESLFNSAKAGAGTFTGMVSKHRTAEFLTSRKLDRSRLIFGSEMDAANDDDISVGFGLYAQECAPMWIDDRDLFADSMALRDLETAMDFMNDEQIVLFDILKANDDLPSACKSSGMSSATFYRRVQDLQMHLRMFGFRSAA